MVDLAQIYGEAVRDYQPTGPGTEQAAHLAGLQAVRDAVIEECAEHLRQYWSPDEWTAGNCAEALRQMAGQLRQHHDDYTCEHLERALRQMAGEK